jgi:hypothetical protein
MSLTSVEHIHIHASFGTFEFCKARNIPSFTGKGLYFVRSTIHGEGWTGRRRQRLRLICKVEAFAWYRSRARLKCTGITTARITGHPPIEAAFTDELIIILVYSVIPYTES